MKHRILLLTLSFLFFTVASQAQSFKLGIKAGVDMNKINGKAFSESFSYGYQAGVFSEIGITKKFSLQPEVIFSQVNVDTASGFKEVYNFDNISKAKLSYVKIPILLSYRPNPFVSLQVGPQFSKLIDNNKSLLQNGSSVFSSGDFSMVGGMQLQISKIRVYGRYAVGLDNLNDTGSPDKWKSQNVQLGLGFTL